MLIPGSINIYNRYNQRIKSRFFPLPLQLRYERDQEGLQVNWDVIVRYTSSYVANLNSL